LEQTKTTKKRCLLLVKNDVPRDKELKDTGYAVNARLVDNSQRLKVCYQGMEEHKKR